MGCGSSTAGGANAPLSKDADDFFLERVNFQKMGIAKWDGFLNSVEKPVNLVVDIVNVINGAIDDVRDATAIVLGAYRVDLAFSNVKDHDRVLLSITKADGTFFKGAEVQDLLKDIKVSTADKKLCAAREAIHKAELTGLKMNAAGDALDEAGAPPQVAPFNAALAALRTAVGAAGKVTLRLQPAGAPGKQGVRARLTKPKFGNSGAYTLLPVTLLEIASTAQAKAIFDAEQAVARTAAEFAKALANCPEGSYQLGLKKKKITVSFPKPGAKVKAKALKPRPPPKVVQSGEDELEEEEPAEEEEVEEEGEEEEEGQAVAEADEGEDEAPADQEQEQSSGSKALSKEERAKLAKTQEQQMALKKAALHFNQQLFKLIKACASINGPITLARGVSVLVDEVEKFVKSKAAAGGADVMKLIKFDPNITYGEDGLDFDLGLSVDLPEFEGAGLDSIVKMMPGSVQLVFKAVMGIKDKITDMMPKIGELKDAIEALVEEASSAFEDPMETLKESLVDDMPNPMELAKMAGAATTNLKKVADSAKVVVTMFETIKRVGDELKASVDELKSKFAAAA